MDQGKIRKIVKFYRASKKVGEGVREYRKLKSVLDMRAAQTDKILDASELSSRIANKEVRGEDVRMAARAAVNSIPDVMEVVVGHIRKHKNAKA